MVKTANLYARIEPDLAPRPLINAATLTDTDLDAEIQRGLDDVAAGRTRPFRDVADELKAEFGLAVGDEGRAGNRFK